MSTAALGPRRYDLRAERQLRAGYDADLLVVDGNPVADIGALARAAAVFASGRRLSGAS